MTRPRAIVRWLWQSVLIAATVFPAGLLQADEQAEYFHQKVGPILREHCCDCHSHAANQMENGLALDWRSDW